MSVQLILPVLNAIGINGCVLLAFLFRYGRSVPEFNFSSYRSTYAPLTFVYLLSFAYAGLFRPRFQSFMDLLRRLLGGIFLGTLLSVAFLYVFRTRWASFPTSVFAFFVPIAGLFLFMLNSSILHLAGCIRKKIVIIGPDKMEFSISQSPRVEKIHCDTVEELIHQSEFDEVVINKRIYDEKQFTLLVCLLFKSKVQVVFSPDLYTEMLSDSALPERDIQFLTTFLGRQSELEEFSIRLLDLAVSFCLLIGLAPAMTLIALLVKLTSAGPIFYHQVRAGKNGLPFTVYKFRTMIHNAEDQTGPVWAHPNDDRITPLGRPLRKSRLDELPQLFNVLAGQMSLVGPRPERPHFLEEYPILRGIRLSVRPGLTGLAQIRNAYDLKPRHKIKYDYLYIQRRSFLLHVYLLFKTVPVILACRGV